jgi:DNA-binding response OmpR family regulator
VTHRVLVVDDLDEVRAMIRRVLQADGYEVDDASSLAEARAMDPDRYDVLLVDANIGPDRGIDLVTELQARDPAAARRCLVITGGARDLPEGISCLHKPFGRTQLLDAVRELHQSVAAGPPGRPAVPGPRPAPADRPEPAPGPGLELPRPRSAQLLGITRELRARERQELSDFLHDGPIQEITATTLELQLMRKWAPPAQAASLDAALSRLDAAAGSLRWLVSGDWPPARPAADLTSALRQQTEWLLAEPLTVDAGQQPEPAGAAEIPVIADVVELLLLTLVPPGLPARAHVAVLTDESEIRIGLTVGPAAEAQATGQQATGAPAGTTESLVRLASALGAASVRSDLASPPWRAQLALRRGDG